MSDAILEPDGRIRRAFIYARCLAMGLPPSEVDRFNLHGLTKLFDAVSKEHAEAPVTVSEVAALAVWHERREGKLRAGDAQPVVFVLKDGKLRRR